MTVATRREAADTAERLRGWLAGRIGEVAGGATDLVVANLELPDAGFSNETAFCEVGWTGAGGREHRDYVLRIQPTAHQLFVEPDALFQARMMRTLAAASDLPVPRVPFVESDPAVFGAPFYVMERVPGRIPPDVPSYHRRGWVVALDEADRGRMYDNGLAALARLHAVDHRGAFDFLAPGGDPLAAYLDRLTEWFRWAEPDVVHDADVVRAGLAHVRAARPAPEGEGLVWGDARVGNMIFDDRLGVAAMLDWEGATVGPPGIDLGWWLVFEDYLCEAQGKPRLAGVPGREATIARYEELAGRGVPAVGYYEVLAALVLSLITSRLSRLLVESGLAAEVAVEYTTRVTGMLRQRLERESA
ncbi:phosphotransferase family protein [Pseudonocardia pini]|uniref:phosphotransferase family protein n=1 Tax=Pseudonocardia pini TaxID=2758030 RepID=UPI0015F11DBC|nr:phosphotransferase family protein [Pseudonocardia pini]